MAQNKKISQLDQLVQADSNDLLAIVDVSASETKRINIQDLFSSPQPIGSSTPSTGAFTTLEVSAGSTINEFSTDTTLAGSSDSALPTENAVKTYVDNQIAAIDPEPLNVKSVNVDSTAFVGDILIVDTTSGDITITLIGGEDGRMTIKKFTPDSNKVIVVSSVGTIDLESNFIINGFKQSVTFATDGSNFFVV